MARLIINEEIGAEGLQFARGILSNLEGHGWVKRALRAALRCKPGEAHDATLLLYQAMRLRVAEVECEDLDDEN